MGVVPGELSFGRVDIGGSYSQGELFSRGVVRWVSSPEQLSSGGVVRWELSLVGVVL